MFAAKLHFEFRLHAGHFDFGIYAPTSSLRNIMKKLEYLSEISCGWCLDTCLCVDLLFKNWEYI